MPVRAVLACIRHPAHTRKGGRRGFQPGLGSGCMPAFAWCRGRHREPRPSAGPTWRSCPSRAGRNPTATAVSARSWPLHPHAGVRCAVGRPGGRVQRGRKGPVFRSGQVRRVARMVSVAVRADRRMEACGHGHSGQRRSSEPGPVVFMQLDGYVAGREREYCKIVGSMTAELVAPSQSPPR